MIINKKKICIGRQLNKIEKKKANKGWTCKKENKKAKKA